MHPGKDLAKPSQHGLEKLAREGFLRLQRIMIMLNKLADCLKTRSNVKSSIQRIRNIFTHASASKSGQEPYLKQPSYDKYS
ncbi:MAG: hypothetical protein QXU09_01720 [Thermoproteota archaeon]